MSKLEVCECVCLYACVCVHAPTCVGLCVFTSPNSGVSALWEGGGKCMLRVNPRSRNSQPLSCRELNHQLTYFIFYVLTLTIVYLSLLDYKIPKGREFCPFCSLNL